MGHHPVLYRQVVYEHRTVKSKTVSLAASSCDIDAFRNGTATPLGWGRRTDILGRSGGEFVTQCQRKRSGISLIIFFREKHVLAKTYG